MPDVEAPKTIKVPLWVYQNAKEVELALIRKGLEHLPPEVLQPEQCPICKLDLQAFEMKETKYVRCANCGYTQQKFEVAGVGESVPLGTAIGMGLVYLLNALFRNGGTRGTSAAAAE